MITRWMVVGVLLCSCSMVFSAETFKVLKIKDMEAILSDPTRKVFVYDVNVESTRKNVGVIPGAQLISDGSDYSVSQTLPVDKKSELVFYCANTMCTASHTAARRALQSGYKNVSVMTEGIYAWRDANKPLEKFPFVSQKQSPQQVLNLVKHEKAVIVDVREKEERHEIIENSKWAPMSQLNNKDFWAKFVGDLPKDKIIVFHCAAGVRSKKMAEKLSQEGARTAYFNGPDEWKKEGLPVVSGPAR